MKPHEHSTLEAVHGIISQARLTGDSIGRRDSKRGGRRRDWYVSAARVSPSSASIRRWREGPKKARRHRGKKKAISHQTSLPRAEPGANLASSLMAHGSWPIPDPSPPPLIRNRGSLGGFPAAHRVDEKVRLGLRRTWVAPRVGLDPMTDLSTASRDSDVLHQTVLHLLTTSDSWL